MRKKIDNAELVTVRLSEAQRDFISGYGTRTNRSKVVRDAIEHYAMADVGMINLLDEFEIHQEAIEYLRTPEAKTDVANEYFESALAPEFAMISAEKIIDGLLEYHEGYLRGMEYAIRVLGLMAMAVELGMKIAPVVGLEDTSNASETSGQI